MYCTLPLHRFAVASALLLVGGSAQAQQPTPQQEDALRIKVPGYLAQDTGCALVLGGAIGSHFGVSEIDEFWYAANREITARLSERLRRSGHKVISMTISIPQRTAIQEILGKGIYSNRCNRSIHLSHTMGADATGNFFMFKLAVMKADPQLVPRQTEGSTAVQMQEEYAREYQYPGTSASLSSFRVDDFVAMLERDLQGSGILGKLRPAPAPAPAPANGPVRLKGP